MPKAKSKNYWRERFRQLEEAQNRKGLEAYAEIERQYRIALREIEGQISVWYQRLADNNGVSMAEARRMLSKNELKEFKWDVNDYIKYGKENAVNQRWMKELENASAKFHISKYEALKIKTQQSLEVMFEKQFGIVSSTMQDAFRSSYYHTAYELQHGFQIGWDIAGLDQRKIERVISKPWAVDGKNFSERIWGNKQKLILEIHNELTQDIILGRDPQKAIDAIAKKMSTSKTNAGRLVMTEEAYFSSAAQKECFNDLDVEKYEIVATLDSHTSDICQSMDGKVFPMKDYEAGVTAPPFHVYCRSCTIPYFEENYGVIDERAARGEDGKTYYVPADMTYPEWKKTFVDGGDKSGFDVDRKAVEKSKGSGIIKQDTTKEVKTMAEIRSLGEINTAILEKEFGKIQTSEIVVTNERISHIKGRHPEDYALFEKYGAESVTSPDLVIKDMKNEGTVFMVKCLPDTNLNVVVRVVLETDEGKLKNSVMTFYRIREKNLKKLIQKNVLLYRRE